MLPRRVLGRTGIEVSALGLGTAGAFAERGEEAKAVVRRAVSLGINYFDTAPVYGNASSEAVLGQALKGIEGPIVISTKLGGRPEPFDPKNADQLRQSVEESLAALGRNYIDILIIHEPDRPGLYDWWDDYDHFHGPVNDVLDDLKSKGLIRYTGLGGTTAYEIVPIIATGRYDVVLTACNYSALWREACIALLPEAIRQNMGIIIGSPLQQGWLAARYDEALANGARRLSPPRRAQFKALYELLDEIDIPLPELAMRWAVYSDPNISMVLTGSQSVQEIEQNVRAVEAGPLDPAVMERLQEIADMVPFRPYEEPFVSAFRADVPSGPGRAGR